MKLVELAGCVISEDEKLLLVHRNTSSLNYWELPGGKVKPLELPETAAAREMQEELGIVVQGLQYLGRAEFYDGEASYEYKWFRPESYVGTPHICEPHIHDEVSFFQVNELRRMEDVSPNVTKLVKKIVDGEVQL